MDITSSTLNKNQFKTINTMYSQHQNNINTSQRNHRLSIRINKSGHWNQKQQAKYCAFLNKFEDKLNERESRRQCKIFKVMAEFIKSRDPNQCRSHHHKMTKSYSNIQQTLGALINKDPLLKKKCQKYNQELDKIDIKHREEEFFHWPLASQFDVHAKPEPENLFKKQKYLQQISIPKMMEIENLRTDVSDGHDSISYKFHGSYSVPQTPFKGFPSTGLLGQSSTTIPLNQHQNIFKTRNAFPQFYNSHKEFNELKWRECHSYYLQWISKLSRLMQSELFMS